LRWRKRGGASFSRVIKEHLGGPRNGRDLLARISHRVSAAAGDAPHPTSFSRLGVLDVLRSTTARPSGRKRRWALRLTALATKPGEKSGLEAIEGLALDGKTLEAIDDLIARRGDHSASIVV